MVVHFSIRRRSRERKRKRETGDEDRQRVTRIRRSDKRKYFGSHGVGVEEIVFVGIFFFLRGAREKDMPTVTKATMRSARAATTAM